MAQNKLVQQRKQQLNQIYQPQVDLIKQQKAKLPERFEARRSALDQAKTNAFRDISQTANRRGMFFSGFQPEEQARHLGEQYLPGLQDIDTQQEDARMGLLEQLGNIRGQRAKSMVDFREQLRQEREQRAAEQRDFERRRQLQREQQAAQRRLSSQKSSQAASQDDTDFAGSLLEDMQGWFDSKGSMPSRQEQDRFVDNWMDRQRIPRNDAAARQVFWDTVNSYYGRTGDPTKDRMWR